MGENSEKITSEYNTLLRIEGTGSGWGAGVGLGVMVGVWVGTRSLLCLDHHFPQGEKSEIFLLFFESVY
jgi:hypothetical protein